MSSSSTPSDPNTLYLSFTSLLYAAVIDAALHRVHDLSLSRENILLVVALIIVVQDYFFYYLDISIMAKEEREKKAHIFWLDILVLGSWYALALASSLSSRDFIFYLILFLTTVALWELAANVKWRELSFRKGLKRMLLTPVPMMLIAILIYTLLKTGYLPGKVINIQNGSHVSEISFDDVCLGLLLFLFLVWRMIYYYGHMRGKVGEAHRQKNAQENEDARSWERVKEYLAKELG